MERYDPIRILGEGSFGKVRCGFDMKVSAWRTTLYTSRQALIHSIYRP